MSKVLSGRVPDELADAVAAYADRRGVKRAVIVEAACRHFLEFARSGVPDLPSRDGGSSSEPAATVVRADIASIRAKAAAAADAERRERERKYAERGW